MTDKPEIPKRLEPTKETARYLFAHSGNECAFEPCSHKLIDEFGDFIAEICHIEAAEPGGERFNPAMTNEDRRDRDNLLVMCHAHHVRTNDVSAYPVARMREIKKKHEDKYAAKGPGVNEATLDQVISKIAAPSIVDVTDRNEISYPVTLVRLMSVAYEQADTRDREQQAADLDIVYPLLDNLRRLPVDTRGVLEIIISRAEPYGDDLEVTTSEIVLVSSVPAGEIYPHLHLLEKYDLVSLWNDDDTDMISTKGLGASGYGDWPFWRDVKKFCIETGVSLESLLIDFRFDQLD